MAQTQNDWHELCKTPTGPNRVGSAAELALPTPQSRENEFQTTADYVAVVGEETIWQGAESRDRKFVTDGESNTLLIAEHVTSHIPWTKPGDLQFDEMAMTVDSDGGICSILSPPAFVTADDVVRFLPKDTKPEIVRALLTARGGEEIDFSVLKATLDGRHRPRKQD